MYGLDPRTGAERPGPRRPPGLLVDAATSPSGNWVVYRTGATGRQLWRAPLDRAADAEPELVASYPSGETVASPAIRNDGRVLAVVGRWYGDLVRVPARAGARF